MSGAKKHWRLSTPFRRFSGKQDPPLQAKSGDSGARVSSVYLSDDSSTNGFVVISEFDESVRTEPIHEEPKHTPRLPNSPAVVSSNSSPLNGIDGYSYNFDSTRSQRSSCLDGNSCDASSVNSSQDDDLTQRLGSAYEHIRSMPSAASPRVWLSSDPQTLRKQLGVPQHSVLNYPIHSSPDLPNPHTPLPEPISPPSAASPNVPQARKPEKLESDFNTNIYPLSARWRRFPDSLQCAERKCVITTPTPPEDSPSKRNPLQKPWSARIALTSQPKPSISNPPELPKRCISKSINSPLPLPSRRSRKPVVGTPPLRNVPRWQISLPEARPASPFRVDIPLHHTWHDRRTDFNSPLKYHSKMVQFHETRSRRVSGSTDALASLTWIGTPPATSSPYAANRGHQPASPALLPDRLSMAIAVEDDSISDDVLVDQLERVRRISDPFKQVRDTSPSRSSGNTHFCIVTEDDSGPFHASCSSPSPSIPDRLAKSCGVPLPSLLTSNGTALDSNDAAVWQAARKALLCIREIIRTEKRYWEALKMLLNAQTATPPPPSMVPYASALVQVSELLLKSFLEDPSAWGVSTAFVTSEDELEATMVSWCAVAGGFFTDGNNPRSSSSTGKWRLRKSGVLSSTSSSTNQVSIPFSPQLPPMLSMANTASKIKERTDEDHCAGQYALTEQERKRASVSPQNLKDVNNQASSRKLSVRDLAIQPIQRVMRYVLLYRNLLDCTPPTSPSRLLVERALEAAMRIANRCDKAQRNPAFCYVS